MILNKFQSISFFDFGMLFFSILKLFFKKLSDKQFQYICQLCQNSFKTNERKSQDAILVNIFIKLKLFLEILLL